MNRNESVKAKIGAIQMPLRERLLDEDETTKDLDDFSALLIDDLKKSGLDEGLLSQMAELTKGVNELHEEPTFRDKNKK